MLNFGWIWVTEIYSRHSSRRFSSWILLFCHLLRGCQIISYVSCNRNQQRWNREGITWKAVIGVCDDFLPPFSFLAESVSLNHSWSLSVSIIIDPSSQREPAICGISGLERWSNPDPTLRDPQEDMQSHHEQRPQCHRLDGSRPALEIRGFWWRPFLVGKNPYGKSRWRQEFPVTLGGQNRQLPCFATFSFGTEDYVLGKSFSTAKPNVGTVGASGKKGTAERAFVGIVRLVKHGF